MKGLFLGLRALKRRPLLTIKVEAVRSIVNRLKSVLEASE